MRREPRSPSAPNRTDPAFGNGWRPDSLECTRIPRIDTDQTAIAPHDAVAHHTSDVQLAAWLDVAALTLQHRRAFAVDCRRLLALPGEKAPEPPDDDSARGTGEAGDSSAQAIALRCAAAADFAREWLARNGLPSSYRREPPMDLLSEAQEQGQYGKTRVAALREWLRVPNRHLLTLLDHHYPTRLRHLDDPPPVLYLQGAIEWVHRPMLAIVGSRRATAQGYESAAFLAAELAGRGWSIVSGLADGIDAAAHRAALSRRSHRPTQDRTALGQPAIPNGCPPFDTRSDEPASRDASTIAVIGTGIDQTYPASNTALRDAIARHGAILSEWPLGTPPKAAHFPQRNRLIAALAQGVVVVEAALRSGSLITARLANELGREVFALPGSIFSPQARGCHALIKDGATLVETVDDILDGLPPHAAADSQPGNTLATSASDAAPAPAPAPASGTAATSLVPARATTRLGASTVPASVAQARPPHAAHVHAPPDAPEEELVLVALGHDAVALDVVCARTGLPASTVAARLAAYEIDGLVSSVGGRFTRLQARVPRTMPRNVLKSTLSEEYARGTVKGPIRASTGNVVESAADSAPRETEADERVIRPGQP
ncbi:DNA-processing protein DprA [Robbsia sp. KACC 23696]|uniref:DNA-processing protein DprA n=1 Tax=Robbsia sp. KACC 23696 TaxID=3149231 RepID=UPI00325C203A